MSAINNSVFSHISEDLTFTSYFNSLSSQHCSLSTQSDHHYSMMEPEERYVIENAIRILEKYQKSAGDLLAHPRLVKDFLRLHFQLCEQEIFSVLFLNNQNRFIALEALFFGTVNQNHVYPREIAKRALQLNAVSLILVHNHPSGNPEPSEADKNFTRKLRIALQLLDIKVVDHLIIAANQQVSFCERGLF